jgi:protein gp37
VGDGTAISWTDATWNPVRGCSRVSEGCRHCYAERVAARFSGPGQPYEGLATMKRHEVKVGASLTQRPDGTIDQRSTFKTVSDARWTGVVRLVPEHLADPLRWRKPRRIFVNSMSDLFHESLTNEQIAAVFGVMAACPQHTFQILTKRAKRMREWFEWAEKHGDGYDLIRVAPNALLTCAWEACSGDAWGDIEPPDELGCVPSTDVFGNAWPMPNAWLGVSVENQAAADERIPELLATPAAVRFLSCEPLLSGLYLTPYLAGIATRGTISADGSLHERPHPPLDWVIAGCESGPGARPCDVAWLRSLRDQCAAAGVPFFLKQAREEMERAGGDEFQIAAGPGSKRKAGGVIELPYLDGVQHASFPEVPR